MNFHIYNSGEDFNFQRKESSSTETVSSAAAATAMMEAATATEDMDQDRISGLPDNVIHHILSFIPDIKEIGRISTLSKQWRQTWRSFPVGDFNPGLVLPSGAWDELRFNLKGQADDLSQRFFRFVDSVMSRPRDGMPRCALYVPEALLPHVDRWIDIALDGRVQELTFHIVDRFSMEEYRYPIPQRILSGKFIRSLSLHFGVEIDGISNVSLPSLRSLQLIYCHIKDEMFARLVQGCPLLEDLDVKHCRNLLEIDLSSLDHVEKVNVVTDSKGFKLLRTNASVVMFDLVRLKSGFQAEVFYGLTIDLSPNITCMELNRVDKSDEWYHRLLSKFPLLETFVISDCSTLMNIVISNPLLKKISIASCENLLSLGINAPDLQYFCYDNYLCDTLPDIWTTGAPHGCAAGFRLEFLGPPEGHQFQEFKRFIDGWSATFECQESYLSMCKREEIDGRLIERVNYSFPETHHIDFVFHTYHAAYYFILDRVLSICRPWYVCLWAPYLLLKTISVDFAIKEEDPDWCGGDDAFGFVFCDGVKYAGVSWIGGVEEEDDPDWHTLYSLPRAETTCVEVGFGLQCLVYLIDAFCGICAAISNKLEESVTYTGSGAKYGDRFRSLISIRASLCRPMAGMSSVSTTTARKTSSLRDSIASVAKKEEVASVASIDGVEEDEYDWHTLYSLPRDESTCGKVV